MTENEIGGACSMDRRDEDGYRILIGNIKGGGCHL
jgi:hypothetical protein